MAELRVRILGCGSSGGVPRVGGYWGDCDPENPRNIRQRCSILVERWQGDDVTRVLVDTSPDLRAQLLQAGVGILDGVIYTHQHADHVHGLDDLRMVVINKRERLPVWADEETAKSLVDRFSYAFIQPQWSSYPPILDLHTIDGPVTISGAGGDLTFRPFEVQHGEITALGFRIADVAYLPDVSAMDDAAWKAVRDLKCWILDSLRRTRHPSHLSLPEALEWIERAAPERAVLTNMHIDLDYQTVLDETPQNVEPAYDGMTLSFEV